MSGDRTRSVDVMNHAPFVAPGLFGREFRFREFQIMAETTFRSMRDEDGMLTTNWGTRVPADGSWVTDDTVDLDRALDIMDAADCEITVVTATKMWSHYWHHRLIMDHPLEPIAEAAAQSDGRIVGAVSYNPFRIEESLAEVERAVRELGFRYVWFHPITFGIAPDDRRCYPLYAKCAELGIPVGLQVGHSAEVLPSEFGRPIGVDNVAIEFPDLKINLSHTGWPWTAEFCSMLWRHPNVYGDISAYFPRRLDAELVEFMDTAAGRTKVMFGTNGLDAVRCRSEFDELPLRDVTKSRVLRDNALEFLGL